MQELHKVSIHELFILSYLKCFERLLVIKKCKIYSNCILSKLYSEIDILAIKDDIMIVAVVISYMIFQRHR